MIPAARSRIILPLRGTALLLIIRRRIRNPDKFTRACRIRRVHYSLVHSYAGSPAGRVVSDICDMNNSIDFAALALRLDINRYESLPQMRRPLAIANSRTTLRPQHLRPHSAARGTHSKCINTNFGDAPISYGSVRNEGQKCLSFCMTIKSCPFYLTRYFKFN